MQYVCLPSERSYIFLSGLKTKMDFAMVYTVVSISHQASKQPLKQFFKKEKERMGALKTVVLIADCFR